MQNLITQKEIAMKTGVSREFVSFALASVEPVCSKTAYLYNIDEVRTAMTEYCGKRAKTFTDRADYWQRAMEKSKNLQ